MKKSIAFIGKRIGIAGISFLQLFSTATKELPLNNNLITRNRYVNHQKSESNSLGVWTQHYENLKKINPLAAEKFKRNLYKYLKLHDNSHTIKLKTKSDILSKMNVSSGIVYVGAMWCRNCSGYYSRLLEGIKKTQNKEVVVGEIDLDTYNILEDSWYKKIDSVYSLPKIIVIKNGKIINSYSRILSDKELEQLLKNPK